MIPESCKLVLPLLDAIGDGEEHRLSEISQSVAQALGMGEEESRQEDLSGKLSVIASYMDDAGLLSRPRPAVYRITDEGREVLRDRPSDVTGWMSRYGAFSRLLPRGSTPAPKVRPGKRKPAGSIEDFQLALPLLAVLGDGREHRESGIRQDLAEEFSLDGAGRERAGFDDRVTRLAILMEESRLVTKTGPVSYMISSYGREVLRDPPEDVSVWLEGLRAHGKASPERKEPASEGKSPTGFAGSCELVLPLLDAIGDGEEHRLSEISQSVAQALGMGEEESRQEDLSGKLSVIASYMDDAGLLSRPRPAVYRITDEGREVLRDRPSDVTGWMSRYSAFSRLLPRGSTPAPKVRPGKRKPAGSIEDFHLALPLLAVLGDGREHRESDIRRELAEEFGLDGAARGRIRFDGRAARLATLMEQAGLVTKSGPVSLRISPSGREVLRDPPGDLPGWLEGLKSPGRVPPGRGKASPGPACRPADGSGQEPPGRCGEQDRPGRGKAREFYARKEAMEPSRPGKAQDFSSTEKAGASSADLPACIPMGAVTGSRHTDFPDCHGSAVTAMEVLPLHLLGATLGRDGFRIEKEKPMMLGLIPGSSALRWAAGYMGPDEGDSVIVSWTMSEGWALRVCWQGETTEIRDPETYAHFPEVFRRHGQEFAAFVERGMKKLQATFIPMVRGERIYAQLPAGCMACVCIPLHASDVSRAVMMYGALAEFLDHNWKKKTTTAFCGDIFLCSCEHRLRGGSPAEALESAELARAASGLPYAEEPRLAGGEIFFTRSVYVLRLATPYSIAPRLLGGFSRVTGRDRSMRPFTYLMMDGAGFERISINEPGGTAAWVFCRQWNEPQQAPDNAAAMAAMAAIEKAADAVKPSCRAGSGRQEPGRRPGPVRRPGRIRIIAGSPETLEPGSSPETSSLLDSGRVRVFYANSILNPMGPTFEFLCARREDIGPGKRAVLHYVSLHPQQPAWKEAGAIEFPCSWDGSWESLDARELAGTVDADSSIGIVSPGAWLPQRIRREFLGIIYGEKAGRVPQKLAQVELYPSDFFSRFDADMAELNLGHQEKAVPQSRLRSHDEAAAELARLSLDPRFQEQELRNFVACWAGSETFVYGGKVEIPVEKFRGYLERFLLEEVYGTPPGR